MREINLNGYIDDEVWYGDEITPEGLHALLYGDDGASADDVHIRLNSYGGSCNAAVRMFDDMRSYPGNVNITVSGTAASAATVLCMAADRLDMTPGSLFMIHNPSMMAMGNEQDFEAAIALLRACKDSILNMYGRRVRASRNDVSEMMSATKWMDANEALDLGFVDQIREEPTKQLSNAAEPHRASREDAENGVKAWFDRKCKPAPVDHACHSEQPEETVESVPTETTNDVPEEAPVAENRVRVADTDCKLEHLKY